MTYRGSMEIKINPQATFLWSQSGRSLAQEFTRGDLPDPLGFKPPKFLRFAPSPNGYLHVGHALSAQLNWQLANLFRATCLLRVEDIDQERTRPEYVKGIFDDLAWLGFEWPEPVLFQSHRFDIYQFALNDLIARELIYPAFLSRKQIKDRVAAAQAGGKSWPKDPDGSPLYPDDCKALSKKTRHARMARGDAYNWRLDMDRAMALVPQPIHWQEIGADFKLEQVKADPSLWGDVVLARRDVPTSYHLSVVLDDAHQSIDWVVRGQDLYQATSIHCLLQNLLDLPQPIYCHHPLITDENMQKLSKSEGATSLKELRETEGLSAHDVRALFKAHYL